MHRHSWLCLRLNVLKVPAHLLAAPRLITGLLCMCGVNHGNGYAAFPNLQTAFQTVKILMKRQSAHRRLSLQQGHYHSKTSRSLQSVISVFLAWQAV